MLLLLLIADGVAHSQAESELAALRQWQRTIEAAEQQWGMSHPAVGRAWLELARSLQAADKDSIAARRATKHAFDICHTLLMQIAAVRTSFVLSSSFAASRRSLHKNDAAHMQQHASLHTGIVACVCDVCCSPALRHRILYST